MALEVLKRAKTLIEEEISRNLYVAEPDLHDTRGDRHLLVWGGLGQWVVVDRDAADFIQLFHYGNTWTSALQHYSRMKGVELESARIGARQLHKELLSRGILRHEQGQSIPKDETIKIANVSLNITNRCNLSCPWCYNRKRKTTEMPIEFLMRRIAQSRFMYTKDASFIILGGEPFIDAERLMYAIRKAESVFQRPVLLSTNGTLLNRDIIRKLSRRSVEIQVSLDSPFPERHNAIRGEGVYEKAVSNVRNLVKAGVYTILSMVYTRDNLDEFEDYLTLGMELGVNEVRFIPLRLIGGGLKYTDRVPDQYLAFQHLVCVLEKRPEFKKLLGRDFFSIAMSMCRYSSRRINCGLGYKTVFIDADGKIYPCPNHVSPGNICGSLEHNSLAGIVMESDVMHRFRETFRVTNYPRCQSCAFRAWCAGDCQGEVMALGRRAGAPSPHCFELQKLYREMLWLIADGFRLSN